MKYRNKQGITVEVITLSNTSPGSPSSRDYYLMGHIADGQWLLVKYPNGVLHGMVRTVEELASLGIKLGELEEI